MQRVAPRNWKRPGLAVLLSGSATLALAQPPQLPADDLVRQTVTNELKAADAAGHYTYRRDEETANGSETKVMIETRDWLVGRTIQINGKPLTSDQRQREQRRLTRLLADTTQLQKEREAQRKEKERVRALFRALPDAFHYEMAGTTEGENGDQLVSLKFHPKPAFEPPTRELRILQGMEGTMSIDATALRMMRVQAQLVRHVNFAWGILAHLDKGNFLLEQRAAGAGRWQLSKLELQFTGKMFLFKDLKIDSTVTTSDFQRMPDNLTLADGLERLRNEGETMTQKAGSQ